MLITSAPQSHDDEYDSRRKKYAIMMSLRALAVLGAALTYQVSVYLAVGFAIAGIVLPWCAVIIANDRPAKKHQAHLGYVQPNTERALPPGPAEDRIVDG
jgi:hypothetical protein